MGDIIVISVLVIVIGLILFSAWRNRKKGGHCCGCSGCSKASSCCSSGSSECNCSK
ncbi:MAG: FeoB-associated Cys-rich membrane protein [Clostridia bacterium]|nr:FeoB-associated Cys-rich membrane protein [Clostridia bacterium]